MDSTTDTSLPQGEPSSLAVYSALILTTFFWGGSFLFNKLGLREIPPAQFVFLRFTLATAIMTLVCLTRLRRLNGNIIRKGFIVGAALGMTNLSFVFGVQGTSISRAGVLNNMFVLFIPLCCAVVWREKIGRVNLAGILLASAGIALLASGGGGFNNGDLMSTVCAAFIAVHIITVSKVLGDEDVYLVSLVQFATVTVMAGIGTAVSGWHTSEISRTATSAVIYCALLPTVICFTMQNRFQRYTTPTRAGLIYTLDPVWSLLAGYIFLGERLGGREWAGCGLIFAAVLLPLLIRFMMEQQLRMRYSVRD